MKKEKRNKRVFYCYVSGMQQKDIAEMFGISRTRVRQILNKREFKDLLRQ